MANVITLIHIDVPLTEPFRISSGIVSRKESIIIQIECDGITAFGEASPMSGDFYSNETPNSTWDFLIDTAIPALIQSLILKFTNVQQWKLFDNYVHEMGNSFAWAGLEGAFLDLTIQRLNTSFLDFFGLSPKPIESGLAVGIYPSIDELISVCQKYLSDGYKRLKIKIEPGWDVEPLSAIRNVFGDVPLMVDANAAYSLTDFSVFEKIDTMNLIMIEQPLAKANLQDHASLQKRLSTPICLDESAINPEIVFQAIQTQACKIVNLKIQRIGGIQSTIDLNRMCAQHGISTWLGTMPELGIGAMHALYLAMSPNCTYPTDVESSQRWFVDEIIDPPIQVKQGWIEIPPEHLQRPSVCMDVIDRYAIRKKEFQF